MPSFWDIIGMFIYESIKDFKSNTKKSIKQLFCKHDYKYVGGMYCKCTKCEKIKIYKIN